MKNTGKSGRQFVAILIALVCWIGPPASIICSPLAGDDIQPGHQISPLAAPSPAIESMASGRDPAAQARGNKLYAARPVSFEANHGQTDARVKFLSRGNQGTLFLMPNEAMITFDGRSMIGDIGHETTAPISPISMISMADPEASASATPLRMKLAGANPAARMTGEEEQAGKRTPTARCRRASSTCGRRIDADNLQISPSL